MPHRLSLALGAAMLALCASCTLPIATAATPTPGAAPELLRVGDYGVQVSTMGAGPYTVIFESGFGRDLNVWRNVAPAIAKSNKVLTYSRAGHGRSEARPGTPSLDSRTDQLEQLIAAAGLPPPFILVGHSYGGFLIRSYAARHPRHVAGMVFVDPSDEHQNAALRKLDPAGVDSDARLLAQFMPPRLQPELGQVQAILDSGKLNLAGPLPDVPVAVLTSVQHRAKPELFLETPAAVAVWRDLHARFFGTFTSGVHVVTSHSGHNIHQEEPQLVINAVEHVIAAADQARAVRAKAQPSK